MIVITTVTAIMVLVLVTLDGKEKTAVTEYARKIAHIMVVVTTELVCVIQDSQEEYVK